MENEKKICIYFDKELAETLPIFSKQIQYVWCISANTGNEDENGWYSTDEGFLSLEDMGKLLNFSLVEIADCFSGFLDIYPKTGSGEWYFTSGKKAAAFNELTKRLFIKNGYTLVNE